MKKELRILVILIAVLLVGTVGYYFMPKKFGKNVNPSEVDHINVFDGNTGTGFTITDSEDIEYIVANIQGISMKRDGISLGRTGYSFKISYINSNDKDIIPVFILNSDNTICKDPFFYRCDGGLCFDYLKACEEKYRTINEQISNFAQTYPTNLKASSNEALLFMRRYRFANCSCFSCCFKDAYPSSNVQ